MFEGISLKSRLALQVTYERFPDAAVTLRDNGDIFMFDVSLSIILIAAPLSRSARGVDIADVEIYPEEGLMMLVVGDYFQVHIHRDEYDLAFFCRLMCGPRVLCTPRPD